MGEPSCSIVVALARIGSADWRVIAGPYDHDAAWARAAIGVPIQLKPCASRFPTTSEEGNA